MKDLKIIYNEHRNLIGEETFDRIEEQIKEIFKLMDNYNTGCVIKVENIYGPVFNKDLMLFTDFIDTICKINGRENIKTIFSENAESLRLRNSRNEKIFIRELSLA